MRQSILADRRSLGPLANVIKSIDAVSPRDFVVTLNERATFLPELLTLAIHVPGKTTGTGSFVEAPREPNSDSIELHANDHYYAGRAFIDRIVIRPFATTRAAWAAMLRGQVDMLYEVGADAIDLVAPAKDTRVFTYHAGDRFELTIVNAKKPALRDPDVRRVERRDRPTGDCVRWHGCHARVADGPVWPDHWANQPDRPRFAFNPQVLPQPLAMTVMYSDPHL